MIFKKKNLPDFTLPVVPVRDIVIFPNTIVPIFVGRRKSILAIEEAIETGKDVIVLPQTDFAPNDDINVEKLPKIGVVCKLAQAMKLPDGTMKVVLNGICRVNTHHIEEKDFISATISPIIQETPQNNDQVSYTMNEILKEVRKYTEISGKMPTEIYQNIISITDPEAFIDVLISRIETQERIKVDILQTISLEERMAKVLQILEHENGQHQIQKEIKKRADRNIEKNNREFYLQEQMKIIKKELGKGDDPMDLGDKYEKKIEEKHLPKKVAEKVEEEIKRLRYLGSMSSEAGVIRGYLDTIFELPWTEKTELKTDIKGAEKYLNETHYGMEKAKERILESIAVQIKTGEQPKRTIL